MSGNHYCAIGVAAESRLVHNCPDFAVHLFFAWHTLSRVHKKARFSHCPEDDESGFASGSDCEFVSDSGSGSVSSGSGSGAAGSALASSEYV